MSPSPSKGRDWEQGQYDPGLVKAIIQLDELVSGSQLQRADVQPASKPEHSDAAWDFTPSPCPSFQMYLSRPGTALGTKQAEAKL